MDVDCTKLISYFGERQRSNGTLVGDALIDLYSKHEVAVSILVRGMQGFGLRHYLRTNSSLGPSEGLPLTAIAVGHEPNIDAVLDQTLELNLPGLVTLERARLLSDEIDPVGIVEDADEATKLTVYPARHDRAYAVPALRRSASCCTGAASPVPPPWSGWTVRPTAAASGPSSSAATPTCP